MGLESSKSAKFQPHLPLLASSGIPRSARATAHLQGLCWCKRQLQLPAEFLFYPTKLSPFYSIVIQHFIRGRFRKRIDGCLNITQKMASFTWNLNPGPSGFCTYSLYHTDFLGASILPGCALFQDIYLSQDDTEIQQLPVHLKVTPNTCTITKIKRLG